MNLLVVGGIDEVSTSFVERIEQLEASLLIHSSHAILGPLVTDAHRTERNGGDVDTGIASQLAMPAKFGCRHRGTDPKLLASGHSCDDFDEVSGSPRGFEEVLCCFTSMWDGRDLYRSSSRGMVRRWRHNEPLEIPRENTCFSQRNEQSCCQ